MGRQLARRVEEDDGHIHRQAGKHQGEVGDDRGFGQMGDAWPAVGGIENEEAVGIGALGEGGMTPEGTRLEDRKRAGMRLEDRKLEDM